VYPICHAHVPPAAGGMARSAVRGPVSDDQRRRWAARPAA
jgi:hypothetical protein